MSPLYEVESWLTEAEARDKYAGTVDWPLDVILALEGDDRQKATGRSWHVGGGQWAAICPECDAYTLTWGNLPIYYGIGVHMVSAHGSKVPGINLGILA